MNTHHIFTRRLLYCLAAALLSLITSLVFWQQTNVSALEINPFRANNDINWYDENFDGQTCTGTGANSNTIGAQSLANVPDPWRSLILKTAPLYGNVDPRLVAAALFVENRGWPDYDKTWAESSAGARGPWQFIPQTWQNTQTWGDLPRGGMGHDGDNDGIRDPNNPEDAVHAAFKHHAGSAGKVLIEGFTGDLKQGLNLIFMRNRFNPSAKTLLSFMANYNGSGAPDGVALKDFPRGENADYVIMSYYVLASNFTQQVELDGSTKVVSAINTQTVADGSVICNNQAGAVNAAGMSFPIGGISKNQISNGPWGWPCEGICHHDRTPAFDLFHVENGNDPTKDGLSVGAPVYAVTNGKIQSLGLYQNITGCYHLQFLADDGWYYWYGHIRAPTVQEGQTVQAGQKIAEIGERKCTGNGSLPHLHIDRGYPKGRIGGSDANRDPAFIPIINQLYAELPQ